MNPFTSICVVKDSHALLYKTRNGTERNGMKPEVIVAQYGRGAGHVARNLH